MKPMNLIEENKLKANKLIENNDIVQNLLHHEDYAAHYNHHWDWKTTSWKHVISWKRPMIFVSLLLVQIEEIYRNQNGQWTMLGLYLHSAIIATCIWVKT